MFTSLQKKNCSLRWADSTVQYFLNIKYNCIKIFFAISLLFCYEDAWYSICIRELLLRKRLLEAWTSTSAGNIETLRVSTICQGKIKDSKLWESYPCLLNIRDECNKVSSQSFQRLDTLLPPSTWLNNLIGQLAIHRLHLAIVQLDSVYVKYFKAWAGLNKILRIENSKILNLESL